VAIQVPNIPIPFDYDWVTPLLAVGSRPNAPYDVRQLSAGGCHAILNVCDVDDAPILGALKWKDCGIRAYLWNSTPDDGKPKPASWFKASFDFAMAQIAGGNPVLVHCFDGVDRSASTVYFLLRAIGWGPWEAWTEIVKARAVCVAMRYCQDAEDALKTLGIDRGY
jgi:hypothetical protein